MTTKPKAARFFLRRVERSAPAAAPQDPNLPFSNEEDGFGDMSFRQDDPAAAPVGAPAQPEHKIDVPPLDEPDDAALAAIAAEGLTGRQLRLARNLAAQHGLTPRSDLDAVLQLRRIGIDPFARSSVLEVVAPGATASTRPEDAGAPPPPSAGRALARLPGDQVQLPQRARPIAPPSTEKRAEVNQAAEILRMQQDIARRRRRKLALLSARLIVFVLLPTLFAGWYFFRVATPIYAATSEFVIQVASPSAAPSGGGLGGLFSGTGMATSQDSITVQGFLQSREAMMRLESDIGFRAHFQDAKIDDLQRLAPDASMEQAYGIYQDFVRIAYDPTEGLIRMEVRAADPQVAATWANHLIGYAEEQVDHLTQRLRADQMTEAEAVYDEAQVALTASQRSLVELQERFKVLSSDSELTLLVSQIGGLEAQLTQERLSLAQMESNPRPNQARMEPVRQRIATLEAEIAALRARMTEGSDGASSLAEVQAELLVAQADLETRRLILSQALQAVETARIEANRQVRFLSVSVKPIPPDEPAYPRAFENTLVTLLILLGIYLMVSMTAAILREQVSA
jgi:capsular polysaccharide transport system permease protein